MPERPCLLMVDDNAGDIELVRLALTEIGLDVELTSAEDGLEGKRLLTDMAEAAEPCRVVLLDLNMPRMDGRQLLAWIRGQSALQALPVMVFTSSNVRKDQEECLRLGATEFWVKPADFAEYTALARRLAPFLS